MTDKRERRLDRLMDATGENTKSGALDVAAEFYLSMGALDHGQRVGAFDELLQQASDRGSLTAPEIAAILNTSELPVGAETNYSVGQI